MAARTTLAKVALQMLQHTATQYNTLQHTATHRNTPHHTLQHALVAGVRGYVLVGVEIRVWSCTFHYICGY